MPTSFSYHDGRHRRRIAAITTGIIASYAALLWTLGTLNVLMSLGLVIVWVLTTLVLPSKATLRQLEAGRRPPELPPTSTEARSDE